MKQLVVVLFVIAMLGIALNAYRSQRSDNRVAAIAHRAATVAEQSRAHGLRDRREFYRTCLRLNANRTILNRGYEALAQIEEHNTLQPRGVVDSRVAAYRGMIVPLLDCGKRP